MATKKKDQYVGAAALTIVKLDNGKQAYVYRGGSVPSDVDDEELLRLEAEGFITAGDVPAEEPEKSK